MVLELNLQTNRIFPIQLGYEQDFRFVYFSSPMIGWLSGNNGLLLKTTDGAKTWSPKNIPTNESIGSLHFISDKIIIARIEYNSKNHIYIPPHQNSIFISYDGGESWAETRSPRISDLSIIDKENAWASGAYYGLYKIKIRDISKINKAQKIPVFQQELQYLLKDRFPLDNYWNELNATVDQIEKIDFELDKLNTQKIDLEHKKQNNGKNIAHQSEWLFFTKVSLTRIGIVGFFVFLASLLINLYRYTTRLSAFYNARADALTLLPVDHPNFGQVTDKLSPDNLRYEKQPPQPTEQLIPLIKEIISITKK